VVDPQIIPAGPNTPSVLFIKPDGSEYLQACVAGFRITRGEPEPILWPAQPESWLIAIESGGHWTLTKGDWTVRQDLYDLLKNLKDGLL
jgi:hypothetical protein